MEIWRLKYWTHGPGYRKKDGRMEKKKRKGEVKKREKSGKEKGRERGKREEMEGKGKNVILMPSVVSTVKIQTNKSPIDEFTKYVRHLSVPRYFCAVLLNARRNVTTKPNNFSAAKATLAIRLSLIFWLIFG